MKPLAVLLFVSVLMFGCNKPADQSANQPTTPANNAGSSASSSPNDPGIAPVGSGAAAGMTPVTNPGAVEGAGAGGVGQAAKDMARSKAASGSSSLNQMPADDGQ